MTNKFISNKLFINFKIISYILKESFKISKEIFIMMLLLIICESIIPFINVILPKYIIDELMSLQRVDKITYLVLLITIANLVFRIIISYANKFLVNRNEVLVNHFTYIIGEKLMHVNYERLEDPDIQNLKEKALSGIHMSGGIVGIFSQLSKVISKAITIIGLVYIISIFNPMITLILLFSLIISTLLYKKSLKIKYKFWDDMIPSNRKFAYFMDLSTDFKYGKEIRLFEMQDLIIDRDIEFINENYNYMNSSNKASGLVTTTQKIVQQIQSSLVYLYIAYKAFYNSITIGEFTLYISVAFNFLSSANDLFQSISNINRICRYSEHFLQLSKIEIVMNETSQTIEEYNIFKHLDNIEIEFKNVYFKYPNSEKYSLYNFSLIVKRNECIAIVGENGAGKTTLIKLLLRLYKPNKGTILVNGMNINNIEFEDYIGLFSAVFQDYKLFAVTLQENINFIEEKEINENVSDVINKVGLSSTVENLPYSQITEIYKLFDKNGVELSGGEGQKLAIARAIYKKAKIIILDEPTASLDPYAEQEIYNKMRKLTKDKTSIFISHRLSSCKFADKIVVISNGKKIQEGTHEELLRITNGKYYDLYNTQAKFYKQETSKITYDTN